MLKQSDEYRDLVYYMKRYMKRISHIALCLWAAVTMTAVICTGCGDNTYADQTTSAEFSEMENAASIRDGFYTIEVPSYTDPQGERMALDTEAGTYRTGYALPLAVSDNSAGQQFQVVRRAEGIYTIQNANTNANVKIRTGLSSAETEDIDGFSGSGSNTVDVELWRIVETSGGDTMLAPYLLTTSLFEQITVESFGTGADLARPWIFTKTHVGINEEDVSLEYEETEYTGEPITPGVTIVKAGKTLRENTDYAVVYEDNRDIGTAKVRVSGIGEYVGSCVCNFDITPIDIAGAGIVSVLESENASLSGTGENGEPIFAYTGSPLTPKMQVMFDGKLLTEGVDYTISLKNNTDPGKAEIEVVGTGIYRGSFRSEFVIGGVETDINQTKTYTFAPASHGTDRLAVKEGGITQGTVFDTAPASEDEKEKFCFFENEDGTYQIISSRSGFCLEDIAGSVRLGEYSGSPGQNWIVRKNEDSSFTFENAQTGQVLSAEENTTEEGGDTPVTTVKCGTESVPKETRDMHFYLVETAPVDAFAEGYYSVTYNANTSYSVAYGTQNGKTGLFIQDEGAFNVMSLIYSGDGWYRVMIGSDNKVLTSDHSGNLSETVWSGTDAQLWRFETSDGTPLTSEMAGVSEDASEENIAGDGTPGALMGTGGFTARLVNKEGLALTAPVDSIDRALNFTADEFLQAVANVYLYAHNNHFKYGNSTSTVPCEDGIISCDRLTSRAVYDLGLTDQPAGGYGVDSLGGYLVRKGFVTFTDLSTTQPGDVMIVSDSSGTPVHTFVVVTYDPDSGMCTKYDLGSQSRIDSVQPVRTLLDEWSDKDVTYGLRVPYTKAPAYAVTASDTSDSMSTLWRFEK